MYSEHNLVAILLRIYCIDDYFCSQCADAGFKACAENLRGYFAMSVGRYSVIELQEGRPWWVSTQDKAERVLV